MDARINSYALLFFKAANKYVDFDEPTRGGLDDEATGVSKDVKPITGSTAYEIQMEFDAIDKLELSYAMRESLRARVWQR